MKKSSFILFSTIILIFIFSILAVNIYQTKSLVSQNIISQYRYIQAKNHLIFLEEYINSLKDLKLLDTLKIEDNDFNIYAKIYNENTKYEIDLYVEDNTYKIRLHKKIFR